MTGRIERRITDDLAREESENLLAVEIFADGRILGRCRSCPKKVRDIRGNGNHAFSSGHLCTSVETAEIWFDAHRHTDLHAYYLNPATREASAEARLLAQIFAREIPKPTIVPFKFARRYK